MAVRLLCVFFILLIFRDVFVNEIKCDELDDIVIQVGLLKEKVDKSGFKSEELTTSVDRLKEEFNEAKKKPENKYVKGAKKGLEVAQKLVANYEKFTSGDVKQIAIGAIDLVGTVGSFIPVAGSISSSICGIITSIIPMIGGKKKSIGDVVKEVINEALDDFRDDIVQRELIKMNMDITANIGKLTTLSKQSKLSVGAINELRNAKDKYYTYGIDVLSYLVQAINKHKQTKNKKKAAKIAKHCYHYAMLSFQTDFIIALLIALFKKNNVNDVSALKGHLADTIPRRNQEYLGFISDIPEGKNWSHLYRSLHVDLTTEERGVLESYRITRGCQPMAGTLARIYNKHWKTYLYTPINYYSGDDQTSRHAFTWPVKEKDLSDAYLFRIFGVKEAKIYNIKSMEYLYVTKRNNHMYDEERRMVTFGRDGKSHYKGMKLDITGNTIRNIYVNEYMYAADFFYKGDPPRRWVFTWIPGVNAGESGEWEIKELSYTENELVAKKTK